MHDRTYSKELTVSNAENGYRDLIAKIDLTSFRRIPWEDQMPFFLVEYYDSETNEPIAPCPRALLKRVSDQYKKVLNALPTAGAELEFFQYKETAQSMHDKNGVNLTPLTPGMFGYSVQRPVLNQEYYYDILNKCREFDVELEGWHTETGPGVFEAAIAYGSAVDMADKAVLFKLICKSIAPKYGILPCFMAKPTQGLPGNSGHIHLSLIDIKTGKNLFSRDTRDENAPWPDVVYFSELGQSFLAGVLDGLADIMPLLAPNINSYKRLVENFWAPVSVSWGLEHRIASIRLISPAEPSSKSTRLEIRTPGADVHTHYAMAAILALGFRGIEKNLKLTIPPMSKEMTTTEGLEKLPRSLHEATTRFAAPKSLAREVLGDAFVDHFAGTRFEEINLWNDAVTNWEVTRYIETA
ncbi:hypothetical protein AWJ20_590 [Sugiyamaella lignohabitans]|uniref:GS catalytic domain-containing protein n=1 Tax=Sugiyamaella lignohabitans TaxID=796027 RepID=A0A167D0U0_9ASCO|nr:uncharacterized protein AWJ20_590 [Sugiyamaella lignohabitans]ANB12340.1 hypothetical protein AWJ20_590 [Sugiyamaella lignohabitans]